MKNFFKMGDYKIPLCVEKKCNTFYILGGIMGAIGIVLAILAKDFLAVLTALILALIIIGIGFFRKERISKEGYRTITGICERVDYTLGSKVSPKNTPKCFIIKGIDSETGKEDRFMIDYYKHNLELVEGDKVIVYLNKNTTYFETKGIKSPNNTLGYEYQ